MRGGWGGGSGRGAYGWGWEVGRGGWEWEWEGRVVGWGGRQARSRLLPHPHWLEVLCDARREWLGCRAPASAAPASLPPSLRDRPLRRRVSSLDGRGASSGLGCGFGYVRLCVASLAPAQECRCSVEEEEEGQREGGRGEDQSRSQRGGAESRASILEPDLESQGRGGHHCRLYD